MKTLKAGTIINGPDGQGYKLLNEVNSGDPVRSQDFEAFGGAPNPVSYELMPEWLAEFVSTMGDEE